MTNQSKFFIKEGYYTLNELHQLIKRYEELIK